MTRGELGSAVFKIVGILVMLKAIPAINGIHYVFSSFVKPGILPLGQQLFYVVPTILTPAIYLVIGYLVYRKSLYLAYLAFGVPEQKISFQIEPRDLQAVAFAVIGIFLVAYALPGLIGNLYHLYQSIPIAQTNLDYRIIETKSQVLIKFLQLLFGIGLFLSGGRISNIWGTLQAMRPMREVGDPQGSNDEKDENKV